MPDPEEQKDLLPGDEGPRKKKLGAYHVVLGKMPSCGSCLDRIPGPQPLKIFVMVALYFLIGYLYYHSNPDMGWDMLTNFYFVSISITTVGYGDYGPGPAGGLQNAKIFTIFYITFGFVVVYGALSSLMSAYVEIVQEQLLKRINEKGGGGVDPDTIPPDDTDIDKMLAGKRSFYVGMIFCLILTGGVIVSYNETIDGTDGQKWTFIEGFYWAFQTTSTIGYGDQYLHRRSRIFGALYAIVSVGMLSTCLSGFEAAKTQADEEKHYRKLMRQKLDEKMIAALDKNGDGVDRAEFLMGMLISMECTTERNCDAILKRFAELDKDGSGKLDHEDLVRIAEQYS
mmetsp:Transcript_60176/g.136058  ORF Transcript_60176/g.136058 Transcript_60176/m.136058 type:complete len:341 (-) Transcript_60176:162-1184(-)